MKKFAINEEFLQQIELLQTLIQNNVSGMFGGNRQSKTFGSSCEFADYRDYIPGDDISKLDWNAYARFDKLYLKLFYDERQMHTRIYIDASRSMAHGDGQKVEQALKLAAAFAYLSVHEMDKVSIYAINDGQVHDVIPRMVGKDSYINSIGQLNDINFSGDCFLSDAILPTSVGYGDGMSIIISDFLTDHNYEAAIDRLCEKKRDVFCIQVLSSEEINPQIRGKSHLFDTENTARFYRKNIDRDIIKAYKKALEYSTERIRNYCMARGAHYLFAPAQANLGELFFGELVNTGVLK